MSVIIRLQNLPWNANAIDIRRFFQGLSIPDGGVHIVGGEKGDAFIAFSTDEDARQAMQKDGGRINSLQIKLLLSSKTEMQNVISAAKGGGPPSVPSGGVKESGFFERSAASSGGSYGVRDVGKPVSDIPFQGGFKDDVYRDNRPRDYPGMQFGTSSRLADERLPTRGLIEPPLGGQSGRPYQQTLEHRDTSGTSRPLVHPVDVTGVRGANSPPRSLFGESGSGMRGSGQQNRITDLHRPSELPADERRQYGDFGQDNRYDAKRFSDERLAPEFQTNDRNYGVTPSARDFSRPDMDMVEERRNLGIAGIVRNVQRPDIPVDGGRFDNRYGVDKSVFDDRVENFNRPDARRDYKDVPEYSRMSLQSSNIRREEPRVMDFEMDRSGWPDDRNSRYDENGGFGRQLEMNARPSVPTSSIVGVARSSVAVPNDGFDMNRPNLRPNIPGSRFSHETNKPSHDLSHHGAPVPDLMNINTKPRIDAQNVRSPPDRFNEEVQLPSRGMLDDQRISQFESSDHRWDARSRDKFPTERDEQFATAGRSFVDQRFEPVGDDDEDQVTVRCSNFPRSFNYKEVRRFFGGCEIPREGLKLVNNRTGSRTGTAYVRFMNRRAAMRAVGMNGRTTQECKVRVEHCSFSEFESAVDGDVNPRARSPHATPRQRSRSPKTTQRQRSRSPLNKSNDYKPGTFWFVVKNLPPNIDRVDIKKLFGKFCIAADGGPYIELGSNNSPTGEAFVAVEKLKGFADVLRALHRSVLNGSTVDVLLLSKSEYLNRIKRCHPSDSTKGKEFASDKPDQRMKGTSSSGKEFGLSDTEQRSFCIHIRGVPFSTTESTLAEFFQGLDIAPNGIHLVKNHEGRAAGDAFIEFTNSADFRKALDKDKQFIGHRYIEVRVIPRQTMLKDYRLLQKQAGGPPVEEESVSLGQNLPKELDLVCMQGLHPDTQLDDILDFFRDYHPVVDSIKLQYKDAKPTGDGLVAFPTRQEAASAVKSKNRNFLLGRLVTLEFWN